MTIFSAVNTAIYYSLNDCYQSLVDIDSRIDKHRAKRGVSIRLRSRHIYMIVRVTSDTFADMAHEGFAFVIFFRTFAV